VSKLLKCDAIFPGCEGEVRAESEDEVLHLAVEHARQAHGLDEIDQPTAAKVKAAIQDA
jgi:predicted small metal-binding protein